MPVSLPPISRRRFLTGSAASAAALLLHRPSLFGDASPGADPDRIALLSDIHIAADKGSARAGSNMADHLQQACDEILKLDRQPAFTLINGDCAYLTGQSRDYQTLIDLLHPLRQAGIPLHLAMGNHDRRDRFWKALPADKNRVPDLADREVLVLRSQRADWIMLDSLEKTNTTPGSLGQAQLHWLAKALDERPDKPAVVMVHHNPVRLGSPASQPSTAPAHPRRASGLLETRELFNLLLPRKRVKALLCGHTHVWKVEQREGLHVINLPAVGYVFVKSQPRAWVDARLTETGMSLELRCLDPNHPWQGEKHDLKWRA